MPFKNGLNFWERSLENICSRQQRTHTANSSTGLTNLSRGVGYALYIGYVINTISVIQKEEVNLTTGQYSLRQS